MKRLTLLTVTVACTAALVGCAQPGTGGTASSGSRSSSYTGDASLGSHVPRRYNVDAPYPGPKAVGAGEQPFVSSAAGGQNRGFGG